MSGKYKWVEVGHGRQEYEHRVVAERCLAASFDRMKLCITKMAIAKTTDLKISK